MPIKNLPSLPKLIAGSLLLMAAPAIAQNLTITNARIIMTPDNIIENGSDPFPRVPLLAASAT